MEERKAYAHFQFPGAESKEQSSKWTRDSQLNWTRNDFVNKKIFLMTWFYDLAVEPFYNLHLHIQRF